MPDRPTNPAMHPSYYGAGESPDSAEQAPLSPTRVVKSGQVVQTPKGPEAYSVVLNYADGQSSAHPFKTIRAGEAFIRSESPMPPRIARPETPESSRGLRGQ